MLMVLGVPPVGAADPDLYRLWVGQPLLPTGTVDVGLRDAPNLEIVAGIKPDFILVSPLGAATRPILDKIAPTVEISTFDGAGDALTRAADDLLTLGTRLGRQQQAKAAISRDAATFQALRTRLGAKPRRAQLVIQFLDARFVRIYGTGSLFGGALARLGLVNAWTQPTNQWGFTLTGIERLAAFPQADIVVVDPVPEEVKLADNPSSLWGNLPAVRAGRVKRLPATWAFGELSAGERFATLLVDSRASEGGDAPR